MSSPSDLQRVLDCGIVAIIRATSGDQLVKMWLAHFTKGESTSLK
jgi:hypothetical protein